MPLTGIGPALVLALLPAVLYIVILRVIDRYEPEPWTFLLASVGLGALAAPVLSMLVLAAVGQPPTLPGELSLGGPTAAIVEQVVKGLLLLVLIHFVRDQFDDVLDGIVYGAALGAGFTITQSLLFALSPNHLGLATTVEVLVAGLNQAFYCAAFGGIVGYARSLPSRAQYWIVVALGLATAAWLDAFHDAVPFVLSRLAQRPEAAATIASHLIATGVNLLGLAALAIAVAAAWRRERRIVRAELHDEVASGTVGAADVGIITSQARRLLEQRRAWHRGGWRALRNVRRLQAREADLAFEKWRTRRRPEVSTGARLDALRSEIVSLRAALEGAGRDR